MFAFIQSRECSTSFSDEFLYAKVLFWTSLGFCMCLVASCRIPGRFNMTLRCTVEHRIFLRLKNLSNVGGVRVFPVKHIRLTTSLNHMCKYFVMFTSQSSLNPALHALATSHSFPYEIVRSCKHWGFFFLFFFNGFWQAHCQKGRELGTESYAFSIIQS